jgi:lysozyme
MKIPQEAINLVKEFEGLRLEAYLDPVGVVTIGYGYTNRAGYGPGVKMGDKWTEDLADEMLAVGVEKFGAEIRPLFKQQPNPHQFGAFVSLAYNIGTPAFAKSTALKRWNAGDMMGCAEAMAWFNKAGGKVLRGLVRRREAEVALFLKDYAEPKPAAPDAPRENVRSPRRCRRRRCRSLPGLGLASLRSALSTARRRSWRWCSRGSSCLRRPGSCVSGSRSGRRASDRRVTCGRR